MNSMESPGRDQLLREIEELMRETFEGGRPGEGTQYLDHDSGIAATLRGLSPAQASRVNGAHPSIASHVRHMLFHLRVAYEWIQGDHSKRDWKGSFLPPTVTSEEWSHLQEELTRARNTYLEVLRALPPEKLVPEGGAIGVISHLAYHLGAIRQHLPQDEPTR
jgi:hypothetical protein